MSEENHEIWYEGVNVINYPKTVLPEETEVLIIGGGITGITGAYILAKAGKKPVLLEKDRLGGSVTDCTTGFLTEVVDSEPNKLIGLYGLENARLIFESHKNAINEIEKTIISEKIDCSFARCSYYIYANNKKEEGGLLKIVDEYKKVGIQAEYKKDGDLKFNNFGYIEIHNQAKFNVIKYLTSLAKIAVKNGAIIAEKTNVKNFVNKDGGVVVEIEGHGPINAKNVFCATYIPFNNLELQHKYNMYRSYVIEYRIPSSTLLEGTYQDTLEPYHYFRVDKKNDSDRLIIGGNDNLDIIDINHEISTKIINDYSKEIFKKNNLTETRHWSGQISEPINKVASVGEFKNTHIFYAFGFSGNGMTYSYIASKMFLDWLNDENNKYLNIYNLDKEIPWWKKWMF